MRFGGVPYMGLHAAYPDLGFLESSLKAFRAEDDDAMEVPISFPSPKLPSFASSKPAAVGKSGRSYAHRSVFLNHARLQRRLKKTLYYGKHPKTERPSLPMTGILVNLFAGCGIQDSLERLGKDNCSSIAREACISPHAVIMALIYVERLSKNNPEFLYSIPSSHLFLVTTMVASKYLYDVQENEGVYNDEWASSANMELDELNRLEVAFLSAVDWSIFVSDEEFEATLLRVEKAIALSQGNARGWFSVTDLVTLGSRADLWSKFYEQIVQQVASVFFVTLTTYMLAALTMTAAVIVGEKATESLAQLVRSTGSHCPAGPLPQELGLAVGGNETGETDLLTDGSQTLGVDVPLGMKIPMSGSRVGSDSVACGGLAEPWVGRMWCDIPLAQPRVIIPSQRSDDNHRYGDGSAAVDNASDEKIFRRLERAAAAAMGLKNNRNRGRNKTAWGSNDFLASSPPLLAGLEDREIPQSTRLLSS